MDLLIGVSKCRNILQKLKKKDKSENKLEKNKSQKIENGLKISKSLIANNTNPSFKIKNFYWEENNLDKLELFERKDLRTFRIERLFRGPSGHLFVFGCYYARPHETFCDPNRMFYKNEVFF